MKKWHKDVPERKEGTPGRPDISELLGKIKKERIKYFFAEIKKGEILGSSHYKETFEIIYFISKSGVIKQIQFFFIKRFCTFRIHREDDSRVQESRRREHCYNL